MIWTIEESWLDFKEGQGSLYCVSVHPDSGARTVSHSWVPETLLPGIKWQGSEADHSPSFSAKIKIEWSCSDLPPFAFMVCLKTTLFPPLPSHYNAVTVLPYLYHTSLWQGVHVFLTLCDRSKYTSLKRKLFLVLSNFGSEITDGFVLN